MFKWAPERVDESSLERFLGSEARSLARLAQLAAAPADSALASSALVALDLNLDLATNCRIAADLARISIILISLAFVFVRPIFHIFCFGRRNSPDQSGIFGADETRQQTIWMRSVWCFISFDWRTKKLHSVRLLFFLFSFRRARANPLIQSRGGSGSGNGGSSTGVVFGSGRAIKSGVRCPPDGANSSQ